MADDEETDTKTKDEADADAGSEDGGAAESAKAEEEEVEKAKETMHDLEEGDPPKDLADWPGGKAKYLTYGGPEGEESYEEAATAKLGPSSLRHHEDGSVSIEGDEVDDPDEYKGEPIPGGPSDPDAPPDPAMVGEEEDDMAEEGENSEGQSGGDSSEEAEEGSDSETKAKVDEDEDKPGHEPQSSGLGSQSSNPG